MQVALHVHHVKVETIHSVNQLLLSIFPEIEQMVPQSLRMQAIKISKVSSLDNLLSPD